ETAQRWIQLSKTHSFGENECSVENAAGVEGRPVIVEGPVWQGPSPSDWCFSRTTPTNGCTSGSPRPYSSSQGKLMEPSHSRDLIVSTLRPVSCKLLRQFICKVT